MAKKIRIKKKDLKRNEAAEILEIVVEWFQSHKKETEYVLWGVFVFVLLITGSYFIYKKKQNAGIVQFSTALRLYKGKSFTKALSAFNGLPSSYSKEKIFYTASIKFEKGDYEAALKKFQDFLKEYPKDEWSSKSLWNIGQIYEHRGNLEKAVNIYKDGIEKYKNSPAYDLFRLALADVQLRMGKLSTAAALYKEIEKDYEKSKDKSSVYNYIEDRLFWYKVKKDESTTTSPAVKSKENSKS